MRISSSRYRLEREVRLLAFADVVDEGNKEARQMEEKLEQTDQQQNPESSEVSPADLDALVEKQTQERVDKADADMAKVAREREQTEARAKQMEQEAAASSVNVHDPQGEVEARTAERRADATTKAVGDVMTLGTAPDHYTVDGPTEQYKQVAVPRVPDRPAGDAVPAASSRTAAERAESQTLAADTSAAQQAENLSRTPDTPTPEKQRSQ